jgi:hypothetical protein
VIDEIDGDATNRDEATDTPYFKVHNWYFELDDVPGDGNCLYHAMAKIPAAQTHFANHYEVRKAIVSYVVDGCCDSRKEKLSLSPKDAKTLLTATKKNSNGVGIQEWGLMVSEQGTWGTQWEAAIFALMLKIDINIVTYLPSGLQSVSVKNNLGMNKGKALLRLFLEDCQRYYLLHHQMGKAGMAGDSIKNNHWGYLQKSFYIPEGTCIICQHEVSVPAPAVNDNKVTEAATDATPEPPSMAALQEPECDEAPAMDQEKVPDTAADATPGRRKTKADYLHLTRQERRWALLDEFFILQDSGQKAFYRNCDKCNISYAQEYPFQVQSLDSDSIQLLGQTPEGLKNLPEFKNNFSEDRVNELCKMDFDELCQWPSMAVEVCVVLMSHAFHCSRVQSVLIPQAGLVEHGSSQVFP